jgi:hypothetical protein
MRALSLWQPWATLVVAGAKRFETRSWATSYRGPLLIHAAKKKDIDSLELCKAEPFRSALITAGIDFIRNLPFGALLGTVELVRCLRTESAISEWSVYEDGAAETYAVEIEFGDYSPGRFAWELRDPKRFAEPVPYRGRQQLFDVPDELITDVTDYDHLSR